MNDQRGFALLAVMLVLALLGVVVGEFAFAMRLEASMVRSYRESLAAEHLAEAAIHQAVREILAPAQVVAQDPDGQIALYRIAPGRTVPERLPTLPRVSVALGGGEFSYRLADEEGRLNVNTASPDRLERLLLALGLGRETRDVISDSLQDWKDSNEEHRLNGAESEDFYLKLPVPYRAKNANLTDPREMLQLKGMTPEIFFGTEDRAGLVGFVTTWGRAAININTAARPVLAALGLSEAEIGDIVQTRERAPYASVPPRFAGRGLAVGSLSFRIEAEGRVHGEPLARLVVVVQRGSPSGEGGGSALDALGVRVLSWRRVER